MSVENHNFKVGDKVKFATTRKNGNGYTICIRQGGIKSIGSDSVVLVYRKKEFTRPIENIRAADQPNELTEIFKGYY